MNVAWQELPGNAGKKGDPSRRDGIAPHPLPSPHAHTPTRPTVLKKNTRAALHRAGAATMGKL
jgi:hypothetical protein